MSHFDKRLDGDSKDVFHTIEVGHLVLNRNCDETEASGEFKLNKHLVDKIKDIAKELRCHMQLSLTEDSFKGLTIQFSDHYFKMDLSQENIIAHKYKLHSSTVAT